MHPTTTSIYDKVQYLEKKKEAKKQKRKEKVICRFSIRNQARGALVELSC